MILRVISASRHEQQTTLRRRVRVGRQQRGAAAAEGAVGEQLDRPHREAIMAVTEQRAGLGPDLKVSADIADHGVDSNAQQILVGKALVHGDVLRAYARIADAGKSHGIQLRERGTQRGATLRGVRCRYHLVGKLHRLVHQHAARIAVGIALDPAADRVGRILG